MRNLNEKKYSYNNNDDVATSEDLKLLLNKSININNIKKYFPMKKKLNIKGSKKALEVFNSISNKKYDFNLNINNIKNIDFHKKSNGEKSIEWILTFSVTLDSNKGKIDIHNVKTIYKSKKSFLNDFFDMDRFAKFALRNDEKEIILKNINEFKKNPKIKNKELNFRFIEDNVNKQKNNVYLRAVVSKKRYKTYDNPIILYMSLIAINNLTPKILSGFYINDLYVTDSKLRLSILEKNEETVEKGIKISTGLRVKNSELGDGAATFNVIYRISNNKNKEFTVMSSILAKINHGNNPDTIKSSLNNLSHFNKKRNDIINAIKYVNLSRKLNENDIRIITSLISHSEQINSNLPDNFKNKLKEDLLNKSFNLLDLFDRLESYLKNKDSNLELILESKLSDWIDKF